MYFQLQPFNANYLTVFLFLATLRQELRNDLVIIWDRLSAHRKAEQVFVDLEIPWATFEYLPAYCPALNPIEHVWSTTKYDRLANWPAPSLPDLEVRLEQEFDQQTTDQALLRSHFEWAGLSLE